jgi:hypothetical protein
MSEVRDALQRLGRMKRSQGWPTPTCRAIRQSDEAYCPLCGIRWSLSDDRPECPR